MTSPEISIVMPTFNRLDRIRRVLEAIAALDYDHEALELVVVSDGSTDGTNEYLSSLAFPAKLRPVFQSNSGPAAARNRGLAEAQGKFIVFVDDDVVPHRDFLSAHMRTHRKATGDVAVIGPLRSPDDFKLSPWVNWEQEMLEKQYNAMLRGDWEPTARQFYTGNASIQRDLLLSAGGFDENFRRAEDVELAYRLADRGVDFIFANDAVGWHYAERSLNSWLDAAYMYGKNDAIFARDRKQSWLIPIVREEFSGRKLPLRLLIKACLGRPLLSAAAEKGLHGVAGIASSMSVYPAEVAAYSGLFGLRYYNGFRDEMGDPDFFSREVTALQQ